MTTKYTDLFFDLDHTLWDYNRNSDATLELLFEKYKQVYGWKFSLDELLENFTKINNQLWSEHNKGLIGKNEIRETRFISIFEQLGIGEDQYPSSISEEYITICPTKTHLIPGAIEVLEYCQVKYKLHLITNGFDDVQSIKIERSGLSKYFHHVITSERVQSQKPNSKFFKKTFDLTAADPQYSLVIGDNPDADILGALDYGVDCIYFNPEEKISDHQPTYEISTLHEIMELL